MDGQRDRLFRALLTAVRLYDDPEVLTEYLRGLGRGHRKYGTLPTHYPAVGEALMAALSQYAPRSWGPRAETAWVRAYTANPPDHDRRGGRGRGPLTGLVGCGDRHPRAAHPRHRRAHGPPRPAVPLPRRAVHQPGDALVAARVAALLVRLGAPF